MHQVALDKLCHMMACRYSIILQVYIHMYIIPVYACCHCFHGVFSNTRNLKRQPYKSFNFSLTLLRKQK